MSSQLRVDKIVPVDGVPTGGGGGIIQIKQGTLTAPASTSTSGSFTDTGLSATITPKFNTSKIFCMVTLGSLASPGGTSVGFRLVRGSTDIGMPDSTSLQSGFTNLYVSEDSSLFSAAFNFLDSPATTSATTYKITWRNSSGTTYLGRFPTDATNYNGVSTLTLMEVSA
tara:strand:- start:165 stop:671 length:507 start_codon:yes stop_codon:yes gene_type:complete